MAGPQYEMLAHGLSRAQEQLAGLVPIGVRQALADRAQQFQPTLARARQMVALRAEAGDVPGAVARLARIPRFMLEDGQPSPDWHDRMRERLTGLGAALPPPAGPSDRLVIAFAFPPFGNTSGNVMARRIEAEGHPVDVISNDMSGRERLDGSLYGAILPLIGQHLVLDAENCPAQPAPFTDFADKAVAALRSGRFGKDHYSEIHSRAMWAQSHFAAAALLATGQADRWIAEFSDPCHIDINGQPGTGGLADDDWLERSGIATLLRERGFAVPEGRTLMFWAEYLAFCLADRLIFTNEAQRDLMLSQPKDPPELRTRAAGIATISAHPVPGRRILSALPMPLPLRGPIWIGFFGNANPRRNLGGLLSALAHLPDDLRSMVRLHLHGGADPGLPDLLDLLDIGGMVQVWPSLDYLDALARMRAMDWLFINDTPSTGGFQRNPWLPSKLADYASAGRPVLAFTEPGSPLSGAELPPGSLKVDMTDENAMLDALIRVASSGAYSLAATGSGPLISNEGPLI